MEAIILIIKSKCTFHIALSKKVPVKKKNLRQNHLYHMSEKKILWHISMLMELLNDEHKKCSLNYAF